MAEGHNVRFTSWAVVLLILVLHSLVLAVVGGVVGLVGAVLGGVTRIMDDAY